MNTSFCATILFVAMLAGCGDGGGGDRPAGDTASSTSATSGPARAHEVGTITGHVKFIGTRPELVDFTIGANTDLCGTTMKNNRLVVGSEGGIRDAVVYLERVENAGSMQLDEAARTMDQRGCQYTPHVIVVPVGQEAIFLNSDPTAHNVRVERDDKILMNVAQAVPGKSDRLKIESVGPHSVECDYHPWMNAYVFGVANSYYSLTDSTGAFSIEQVPVGTYTLRMWLNGYDLQEKRDNNGQLIGYRYSEPVVLEQLVEVSARSESKVWFKLSTPTES